MSLPLFFEPNQGQTDSRVKFMARGSGYGLFLTSDEAVLSLQRPNVKGNSASGNVIRMHLEGVNGAANVQGTEPLPGKSNYFIGNDPAKWHRGIPQFGRVEYRSVYPGIDLIYYGNQRQLEYDFRVAPGADPNQIALNFEGASARLDSGELILSTSGGEVRFHAPHIYQLAQGERGDKTEETVTGSFRQIAASRVAFSVGPYDHSRELVIDPILSYSTFLGEGGEVCTLATPPVTGQIPNCPQVAVDTSANIYIAGSTTSSNFPITSGAVQATIAGPENLFISELNPLIGSGTAQLIFSTYLGGNGTDSLAGIALDPNVSSPTINIYVAGTTTSTNFPTTANAFEAAPSVPGIHGFISVINISGTVASPVYALTYSTYLAGATAGGADIVSGLAVDSSFNAYVTGTTTSTNTGSGFPSTPSAYQLCPFQPNPLSGPCTVTSGPAQFFASQINTQGSGAASMLYSTYFGGGYPSGAVVVGGGIAVDSGKNMYFTGTTNMPSVTGANGEAGFPVNANGWQTCLNQGGVTTNCGAATTNTDAILVKINPTQPQAPPAFATYLGGSGNEVGTSVAVDLTGESYVTGSTNSGSTDWNCGATCVLAPAPFNAPLVSGATNAFLAKISNQEGTVYPLILLGYMGGTGPDTGQAIAVDSNFTAHIAGTTYSSNLPFLNPLTEAPIPNGPPPTVIGNVYGGNGDVFVASISTSQTSTNAGDYLTYLGSNGLDQGSGLAIDQLSNAYVVGTTTSSTFPLSNNPYQATLNGAQNAFITELGTYSKIALTVAAGSPSPNPVNAGTPVNFTYNLTNNGPDPTTILSFFATVPGTGIVTTPSATVNNAQGTCGFAVQNQGGLISCTITSALPVGSSAQVVISLTPTIPPPASLPVSGYAVTNGQVTNTVSQPPVSIDNFNLSATTPLEISAGQTALINVTLTPAPSYSASVTMTQTTKPSMVTATAPVFSITPVVLAGTTAAQTQLSVQTVQRPTSTGSLVRHGSIYATWLPLGGLTLAGLGFGAGRRRRRWIAGALLGLLAGLILLQPACGSSSNSAAVTGGTAAGIYTITITGSAGNGAANITTVQLQVD